MRVHGGGVVAKASNDPVVEVLEQSAASTSRAVEAAVEVVTVEDIQQGTHDVEGTITPQDEDVDGIGVVRMQALDNRLPSKWQ